MTPEEEKRRAMRAQAILNDDMVVEAFAMLDKAIYAGWKGVSERDTEAQKNMLLMAKTLDKFKRYFASILETGELAEIQEKRTLFESARHVVRGY